MEPSKKQPGAFSTFFLAVFQILTYTLIVAGIAGLFNTYFDLDLAIRIGGSKIPLLNDYFGNLFLIILGLFFKGIEWIFSQKKVRAAIKKNKVALIGIGLAVLVGLIFGGKSLIIHLDGGPAMWAISNDDLEGLKAALAETPASDEEKSAMLFRALQSKTEIVEYLLKEGTDPNSKRASDQLPAIQAACTWGKAGMVEALKEAGATGECPKGY